MYEIAQCQEEFNLCPGGNEQNGYGGELKKTPPQKILKTTKEKLC